MTTVRVALPAHLRTLAKTGSEVQVSVADDATVHDLLNEVESAYPMLRGTIRDHTSHKRRAYLRFYACGKDMSHLPTSTQLPSEVMSGSEAFIVLGAISGG